MAKQRVRYTPAGSAIGVRPAGSALLKGGLNRTLGVQRSRSIILWRFFANSSSFKFDKFAKSRKMGWLSKNRQIQGAQISRNEAYFCTLQ
jgi:hypothetical protein